MSNQMVPYRAAADAEVLPPPEITSEVVRAIADGNAMPSAALVAIVRDAVQRYGIPITGLNILGGRVYVNIAGLTFLANQHPDRTRRVRALSYEWLEVPSKENGSVGGVKARCELWDGSVFENEGWIDPETEKMAPMRTLSNMRHKVLTKAFARVLRLATGVGLTAVEEFGDRAEAPVIRHEAPGSEPMPQAMAYPSRSAMLERARERLRAAAEAKGFTTPRQIASALGLPDESGALAAWADKHGYDAAAKLIEDGLTVADFKRSAGNALRAVEAEPEAAPLSCPECAEPVASLTAICQSCGRNDPDREEAPAPGEPWVQDAEPVTTGKGGKR